MQSQPSQIPSRLTHPIGDRKVFIKTPLRNECISSDLIDRFSMKQKAVKPYLCICFFRRYVILFLLGYVMTPAKTNIFCFPRKRPNGPRRECPKLGRMMSTRKCGPQSDVRDHTGDISMSAKTFSCLAQHSGLALTIKIFLKSMFSCTGVI